MADKSTSVVEAISRYSEAVRITGQQNEHGQTIGLSRISWAGLRRIPMIVRLLGGVLLFLSVFFRKPLAGLVPAWPGAPEELQRIHDFELFSVSAWAAAMAVYLVYIAVTFWKGGIYLGLPGLEVHFTKHQKMVKMVKPGQREVIVDPWVKPYAVVSTKSAVLEMDPVEGNTANNISVVFNSAMIFHIGDPYRLLVQGGFETFLRQINELYRSVIIGELLKTQSSEFRRFMIEPVALPKGLADFESVTAKLAGLEKSELDVEPLTRISEIGEADLSQFDLSESETPQRRQVLAKLLPLADQYGIVIEDMVPRGNLTSKEYLETLAMPVVSSIARLRQAVDKLRDIKSEENEEVIAAAVADKKLGVLKIDKIIAGIRAVKETLGNDENIRSIIESKNTAMRNIVEGEVAAVISEIEGYLAKIRSKEIATTGQEQYLEEVERLLSNIEQNLDAYVPHIGMVVSSGLSEQQLIPDVDIIEMLMDRTGTRTAFEKLRTQAASSDDTGLRTELGVIKEKAARIEVEEVLRRIQGALNNISASAGISVDEFKPENVKAEIDKIAVEANVAETETPETALVAAERA